ncbi:hypothetical protein [Streptomyces sp. NPDC004721]
MAAAQQATPITPQVAMTLAAIAATGATPRPSGETLQAQTDRIKLGISRQFSNSPLTKNWTPTWLALSPDNANMAYIAKNNDGSNQFAVVVRGTIASVTDILEDLDVGTVVPFTARDRRRQHVCHQPPGHLPGRPARAVRLRPA